MIVPHGGELINRIVEPEHAKKYKIMPFIFINSRTLSDLELIATGAFSPLTGFIGQKDYRSVLKNMRLSDGTVWPIPITLPVSNDEAAKLEIGSEIGLKGFDGKLYGILKLEEKYKYNKKEEAEFIYGTTDINHPGVQKIAQNGDIYLSGPIYLLERPNHSPFEKYFHDPIKVRKTFQDKGWQTIVGFQTRNPIHRAHEYIQKTALEITDGLLIHPIIGETKQDDIPADLRMKSYEALLDKYYPKDRVILSVFPAAMRYAGPREALFHAIVRKNYGCTHFIIGRDHAGVGNYYGTYDSQKIFNNFSREEIGIRILKFEHAFFCTICDSMCTSKTCSHDHEHHLFFSGTKVRQMLRNGQSPPKEFTRPEVAQILINGMKKDEL
jgi:sulfate adenylyltransferase